MVTQRIITPATSIGAESSTKSSSSIGNTKKKENTLPKKKKKKKKNTAIGVQHGVRAVDTEEEEDISSTSMESSSSISTSDGEKQQQQDQPNQTDKGGKYDNWSSGEDDNDDDKDEELEEDSIGKVEEKAVAKITKKEAKAKAAEEEAAAIEAAIEATIEATMELTTTTSTTTDSNDETAVDKEEEQPKQVVKKGRTGRRKPRPKPEDGEVAAIRPLQQNESLTSNSNDDYSAANKIEEEEEESAVAKENTEIVVTEDETADAKSPDTAIEEETPKKVVPKKGRTGRRKPKTELGEEAALRSQKNESLKSSNENKMPITRTPVNNTTQESGAAAAPSSPKRVRKKRGGARNKNEASFGKEAKDVRAKQEVIKDDYQRLVRAKEALDQASEERGDDVAFEYPDEPALYDVKGAEKATVPPVPSDVPDPDLVKKQEYKVHRQEVLPEKVALGVPIKQSSGARDGITLHKEDYRRRCAVPTESMGSTQSYDELKAEYRRMAPPPAAAASAAQSSGSTQSYNQLKEDYRQLAPPPIAAATAQSSTGSSQSYDELKDDYRRLARPSSAAFTAQTSMRSSQSQFQAKDNYRRLSSQGEPVNEGDAHGQIKDQYRRLARPTAMQRGSSAPQDPTSAEYSQLKEEYRSLSTSSDHRPAPAAPQQQSRDISASSDHGPRHAAPEDNPYANYNPYRPGAHEIHTSGALDRRPTLSGCSQYSSERTNADSYLVSAELVRDKSQRFRDLEERQEELEKQIEEQTRLLSQHEELLSRLRASQDPLSPLSGHSGYSSGVSLSPASSAHTRASVASFGLPPPPMVVQATVVENMEELQEKISEREKRIQQREAELNRLKDKSKQKKNRISRLKNLFGRTFRKKGSHLEDDGDDEDGDSTIKEDFGSTEFMSAPNLDRGPTGGTDDATFGSVESLVGKETLDGTKYEEEKEEITPEKLDSSSLAPDSDVFDGFSLPDLMAVAVENRVDINHCSDRVEIVAELTSKGVSPNPKTTIGSKKRSERFIAVEKCPFDGFSISELKKMADKAQIDTSSCFDRGEIVTELRNGGVLPTSQKTDNDQRRDDFAFDGKKRSDRFIAPEKDVYDGFKISQLKAIAAENGVDLSGCVERGQIVRTLLDAGVTPTHKKQGFEGFKKGVRIDSSNNDTAAPKVVEGHKREATYATPVKDIFDGLSISRLKQLARETGTDISSCVERGQICNALKNNGVRPDNGVQPSAARNSTTSQSPSPKRSTKPRVAKPLFQGYTIGQLKMIAREENVDVSACVERGEIIKKLETAGVRKENKLLRKDFGKWSPAQLRELASAIGADLSLADTNDREDILDEILFVGNVSRPEIRNDLRGILGWASMSLSQLRTMAQERSVNISDCVEKEEVLGRLVKKRCG